MGVLLAMVGKDLRRRVRSPLPTLLLLAFPLIFAALLALTFGGKGDQVPKVRLLIDDRDGGLVGQLVSSAFQQGDAQKYFEVKKVEKGAGEPAALLEREDATALLRLPAGLSNDVFAGRPAKLELVKSPAQSILPDVAEQITTVLAEGLSSASRLLRGPLDQIQNTPPGGPSDPRVAEIAVLTNQAVMRARPYVLPPVITLEAAVRPEPPKPGTPKPPAGSSPAISIFLIILPGISVYSLFNLSDQTMRDLLVEARLKTLRRQLAGPVTVGRVLAGKTLATAAVAAISLFTLTLVGAAVAPHGISLVGYLLLSFALVIATTGFSSFIFSLARGEKQGATLANLASLLMAFAGGAFLPLNSLPAALRAISPGSLMYWANTGFQKLISEGAGLQAVLPNIAILAGAGLLLLAVSAPLWRRRLLRGDIA